MPRSGRRHPLAKNLYVTKTHSLHPAVSAARLGPVTRWIGPALCGAWLLVLCFSPDPLPLGAPNWMVAAIRFIAGLDEPAGRLIATLVLRATGLALLGALLVIAVGANRWGWHALVAIAFAPVLAVATLWVNLGYFPIALQIGIATVAALAGATARLAVTRNPVTAAGLLVALAALFSWGTATSIDDELDAAARAAGRHLLASADNVPEGDAGFARVIELAFTFASEHSLGRDPVLQNRAAILALAVILGEERLAKVAARHIDPTRLASAEALRARITAYGRSDWPRHFWVSAGLTLLADEDRSLAIGLGKELMDAAPGGTGFSFPDLAADAAGNLFTLAATRDARAARNMQTRILAGVAIADFIPDMRDLPEGITRERFRDDYGGLGGAKTQLLAEEIRSRLAACRGLR
jgi:hypothetical protein